MPRTALVAAPNTSTKVGNISHLKPFAWFTLNAAPVAICVAIVVAHFLTNGNWQFTGALLALSAAFSLSVGHAKSYKISKLKTGRGWAQAFGTITAVAAAWFLMVDANDGNLAETMKGLGSVIFAGTGLAIVLAIFWTATKIIRNRE